MKKVIYLEDARDDLTNIHEFIARDNPVAANQVVQRIELALRRLSQFAYSGRPGDVEGTYELVVPRLPYIAVYRITDVVEIVSVFHTSQNR